MQAAGSPIETLDASDLPGALELSRSASWNQNEADWRTMLVLGRGWCIRATDAGSARLAASIVVLPYGSAFAWISMVLVLPEFRGRGLASRLLRHALAELTRSGRGGVLDATPAGRAVYLREGFVDSWGFGRYRRQAAPRASNEATDATAAVGHADVDAGDTAPAITVRPLHERDWPSIAALDRPAFGADRSSLLRRLAQRLPQAAHVAERGKDVIGFVFGRDGREATQLGPLVAGDEAIAHALLDAALAPIDGPVYVDAIDAQAGLPAALAGRGFVLQRPFTRMLHGLARAPGDASKVFLVAGPELG